MTAVSTPDLTERQAAFVDAYVSNGGNALQAAVEAGYSKTSAKQEGSRLLRNPKVAQALARAAADHLARHAPVAMQSVFALMTTARSEKVRLEAAKDWLDRAGLTAVERHQHLVDGELRVVIDLS